jgi:hypothetical protein
MDSTLSHGMQNLAHHLKCKDCMSPDMCILRKRVILPLQNYLFFQSKQFKLNHKTPSLYVNCSKRLASVNYGLLAPPYKLRISINDIFAYIGYL